jgi:hypothetical protein
MKEITMTNKIFVSMPSWRDPFVYETIKSAYEQAYNKDRLVFGVLFQGYPEDDWMIDTVRGRLPGVNINIKKVHGDDAPDYLCDIKQAIIDNFMTDEAYYMQVDCHTKFRRNWDIMLEAELAIANELFGKSIINSQTIYFNSWTDPLISDPLTSHAAIEEWSGISQMLDFKYPISLNGRVVIKPENTMISEKFYNGNMVFASAEYVRECPFPKNISQCFEQQTSMLRAWTAGYNVISPVYQYTNNFDYWRPADFGGDKYVRHIRWDRPEQKERIRAANLETYHKYNSIFTDPLVTYNKEYGAFANRTIEEYIDFIGYDPVTLEIFRSPEIDIENSKTVTQEMFSNAILKIAKEFGYDITDTDLITNDPHTRKRYDV